MKEKSPEKPRLRNPWLVAAWPGLGSVATIAGTYLGETLQPDPAGMISPREFFGVDHVEVRSGIARSGPLPRSMFFVWRDPDGKRDLIIFLGEAQPATRGYALCRRIMEYAIKHGVKRVVTFAAMGTQLKPSDDPRVFGAVTAPELLDELRNNDVDLLQDGQVGGLNGALLAAAAERDVPAMCLLGEFPAYAANMPNPRAALAVLLAFSELTGVEIDLSSLAGRADQMDAKLTQLLEKLQQAGGLDTDREEGFAVTEPQELPVLDVVTRRHIEDLFGAATEDRAQATALKQELDRLGVFDEYEDRFLDLFK